MEEKDWKKEYVIEELKKMYIDCPECINVQDDVFKCLTCGNEGGEGSVNVLSYLRNNKDILD